MGFASIKNSFKGGFANAKSYFDTAKKMAPGLISRGVKFIKDASEGINKAKMIANNVDGVIQKNKGLVSEEAGKKYDNVYKKGNAYLDNVKKTLNVVEGVGNDVQTLF